MRELRTTNSIRRNHPTTTSRMRPRGLTKRRSAALRPHETHPIHNTSAAVAAATRVRTPMRRCRPAARRAVRTRVHRASRAGVRGAATDHAPPTRRWWRRDRHDPRRRCNDADATPTVVTSHTPPTGRPHTERHAGARADRRVHPGCDVPRRCTRHAARTVTAPHAEPSPLLPLKTARTAMTAAF